MGRLGIAFGCVIAACIGALLALVLTPVAILVAALLAVARPARAALRATFTRAPALGRCSAVPPGELSKSS